MSASTLGGSSALQPAGIEAARTADLFWIMLIGGVLIWLLTLATALYVALRRTNAQRDPRRLQRVLIVGGGLVLPTILVSLLLVYSLSSLRALKGEADGARIAVTGERFWWRVEYDPGGPTSVELANEIRLPVGRRSELLLRSPDLIHSLWIPALAGKLDLIPGRENRLVLEPTRIGRYQGLCAEYCGLGHTRMLFTVEVVSQSAFADWLAQQRAPTRAAITPAIRRGEALFTAYGCPACHAVRGTGAIGRIGPDLTHLASRATVGAAGLPLDRITLVRWIRDPAAIKPGVLMPAFVQVPDPDLAAIADYLLSLQ